MTGSTCFACYVLPQTGAVWRNVLPHAGFLPEAGEGEPPRRAQRPRDRMLLRLQPAWWPRPSLKEHICAGLEQGGQGGHARVDTTVPARGSQCSGLLFTMPPRRSNALPKRVHQPFITTLCHYTIQKLWPLVSEALIFNFLCFRASKNFSRGDGKSTHAHNLLFIATEWFADITPRSQPRWRPWWLTWSVPARGPMSAGCSPRWHRRCGAATKTCSDSWAETSLPTFSP